MYGYLELSRAQLSTDFKGMATYIYQGNGYLQRSRIWLPTDKALPHTYIYHRCSHLLASRAELCIDIKRTALAYLQTFHTCMSSVFSSPFPSHLRKPPGAMGWLFSQRHHRWGRQTAAKRASELLMALHYQLKAHQLKLQCGP